MKLFLIGAFALTAQLSYAQIEPTDSITYDQDTIEDDPTVNLQETLIIGKGVIDLEESRKTPVAVSTITREEIQDKAVGNVEFPEIMSNTPSVYVTDQSSGFGDSRMMLRGFDQSNTAFLLNGQPINGMEDGNMYWSNWSAMTEVANAVQIQRGLGSSKLAISSVGGTVNIITKATERRQGGFARFVAGNDSYLGGTISYDTGLKGKWGASIMINHWQAHRKWADGTAGQGQSYFLSVGYKPNDNHNLNFMIFGAPQWHDQNFATKSDAQWARGGGDKRFNTTYGYLDGEGKNLRRNYYHKPVANLNWDWTINENASLSTVIYASLGRGGGISGQGAATGTLDANNQIDFGAIIRNNLADPDGIGNNGGGSTVRNGATRSSVNNHFWYGTVTNFTYDTKKGLVFSVGGDLRFYKGDHFQQMVDLFGLNSWSQSATNLANGSTYTRVVNKTFSSNPWKALFNFADKDERTGRDYNENINYQGVFGQVEYEIAGFSVFAQGSFSNQSYQTFNRWNYGGVEHESKKIYKTGYNVKGGLAYSFLDANSVFFNVGRYSRQPFLDSVFEYQTVNVRTPEVENEEITGFEAGYRYKTRGFNLNINLYHTEWGNRFLYLGNVSQDRNNDGSEEIYSQYATDVSQVHKGIEIDFDTKISRDWTLRGFASIGDWKYKDSTPYYEIAEDDTNQGLAEEGSRDLGGYEVGGAAQFTFGLGTRVNVTKGLSFDTDFNYYALTYEELNVLTTSAPNKIPAYTNLNLGGSYEFKFGTQRLKLRGNIKNVFNELNIVRINSNGYGYNIGRTWNASVTYSF